MLYYIFWGFTAFMLVVWIVVTLYTLIKGSQQKRSWKEILKILFKRVGIVVVIYIALFYIGGFHYAHTYKRQCSPNAEDIKLMTPQAEVITNYILQNGIPKSMAEIPNVPYKLENCVRERFYAEHHPYYTEGQRERATGDEVLKEKCTFTVNERTYDVSIRFSVAYKRQYLNASKNSSSIDIFDNKMLDVGGGRP